MENKAISVDVMIDKQIFRQFAVFDYLYRRRRWVSPVIFASIMSVFACVCFVARDQTPQAVMVGCVLLIVGLGLPAVHLWSFFESIKSQIKSQRLQKPRPAYSLQLSGKPGSIQVTNPAGESARYEWDNLHEAYRVDGCTYLYVAENKAFLLPDGQVEGGSDALWSLFADMLPSGKLHNLRRIK